MMCPFFEKSQRTKKSSSKIGNMVKSILILVKP